MTRGRNSKHGYDFEVRDGGAVAERLARLRLQRLRQQVQVKRVAHSGHNGHQWSRHYMYTVGLSALYEPKVELICLNCPKSESVERLEGMLYGLADEVKNYGHRQFSDDGERPAAVFDHDGDPWIVTENKSKSKVIRKHFAAECDRDVTFLLVSKGIVKDGSLLIANVDDGTIAYAAAGNKHVFHEIDITGPPPSRYQSDHCDHCGKENGGLLICSACDSVTYCSSDCQHDAWESHKESCREKMRDEIRKIWNMGGAHLTRCGTKKKVPMHRLVFSSFHKEEKQKMKDMFVRHINGDIHDNTAANLALCHPHTAFSTPGVEADWWCSLSKVQISYVKKRMSLFAKAYEPQEGKAVSHDEAFERMSELLKK